MLPVADSFNFVVCGFATLAATVGYAYARKTRPLPSRGVPQPQNVLPRDSISNSSSGASSSTMLEKPADGASYEEKAEFTPTSSVAAETSMDEDSNGVQSEDSDGERVEAAPPSSSTIVFDHPMAQDSNGVPVASKPVLEFASTLGDSISVLSKNNSLKRKRNHEQDETLTDPEMGYPHNLNSIYPNKRRSDSVSDEDSTKDVKEMNVEPCEAANDPVTPPSSEPNGVEGGSKPEPSKLDEPILTKEPKPAVVQSSDPEPPKIPTEVPRFAFKTAFPRTPPRITHFTSTQTTSPGFANFAGSSSPFFQSASLAGKPVWANASAAEEVSGADASPLAPATAKTSTLAGQVQPHSTGEEDEDVALELKGVKLYIKRGEDNFSSGMMGHIKLLSHKTTSTKRLLFRREPLWKVSMNVRMQPTVRCAYDPQENILRVVLKELPEKSASEEAVGAQVVIYAFKPSRSCRRSDFQEFAEALLVQARQGGPET
ncbi:hypothetical protein C8R45DRAFT_1098575 [Mycena sanguinolenta]|nr:hypothetical protein C8R45DRAFT_1098575 [Mycena sanguinolenta]